jgi:hypothetical protein
MAGDVAGSDMAPSITTVADRCLLESAILGQSSVISRWARFSRLRSQWCCKGSERKTCAQVDRQLLHDRSAMAEKPLASRTEVSQLAGAIAGMRGAENGAS